MIVFVIQVYNQYVDFITLEDDLFCLRQIDRDTISYYGKLKIIYKDEYPIFTFLALNRPQMRDADMDEIIDTIVDCLFSVCVTLGTK